MSLFPAYAENAEMHYNEEEKRVAELTAPAETWNIVEESDTEGCALTLTAPPPLEEDEAALLASDSGEEAPMPPPAAASAPLADRDFYLDGKADNANLAVSTLYYPGRPIYKRVSKELVGGSQTGHGGFKAGARRRRYYLQAAPEPEAGEAREVAARVAAFRDMLRDSPRDPDLWLRFIRFQEEWGDGAAWLAAAEAGARGAGGRRLRAELHRARRARAPHHQLLQDLTADLQAETRPAVRLELWLRLAGALGAGGAGGAGGAPAEVQHAASAALADLPREPTAYPHLFYVYGATLRAAGLWEQLVLLVELTCAMNFPPSSAFPPPPPSAEAERAAEERLQAAEDAALASGLPLGTVWVRVERLRAARHWRPLPGGAAPDADPQRAPTAASVAPLLRAVRPAASLRLCAAMLRLAAVPLLPASQAAAAAWGGAPDAEAGDGLGAALPALWRARRRLRPGRDAGALRRWLPALLDPPHQHCDAAGFATWTGALWDAALAWLSGRRRLALACWRLRWLAALALLAEAGEARRLRALARRVLKRGAPAEPVAYALFARLEADAGDEAAARRVALQAVRAACGAEGVPREQALFCARVLRELVGRREPALGAAALVAAALGRPLAPEPRAPAAADLRAAAAECAERCLGLEEAPAAADAGAEEALCAALTCGAGEWQAARVELLAAPARAAELAALAADARAADTGAEDAGAVAWREARAVALALAAGLTRAAPQLHALFPDNALLALANAERAAWGGGSGAANAGAVAALAGALEPLERAAGDAGGAGTARLARAAARGAGAAAATLRLEAAARAGRAPQRALLAALQQHANHKWLYVRGAAWAGADSAALAEALLERGLRAHALLPELRALLPPAAADAGAEEARVR